MGHPVTSQQGTATIEITSGGVLPSHQSKHLHHNEKREQLNHMCHGDPRHNVHVQTAVKCDQGPDSIFGIRRVVDSLNETLKQNQLPKLELTVFGGDSLEFQQWLICFEKLIESNTREPAQKLQYLMQYTVGDAYTLVSGYSLDMSESGYRAAKQELIKEYGDPYVLSRAYLKRVDSWKPVPPNDVASLKTFCIFLKKCRGSMSSLRHLAQLNTDSYLQKIVAKLSPALQESWRKTVNRIEEDDGDATFGDLVNFIEQQVRIAKHPVYSADALAEAEGREKSSGKSSSSFEGTHRKNTLNLATNATVSMSSEPPTTCVLCFESHDLDACDRYMSRSLEDRKRVLYEKRLCYACYGSISDGHIARTCRQKRTCRICNNLHPTGLHDFRFRQPAVPLNDANTIVLDDNTSVDDGVPRNVRACATNANIETTAMNIVMVRLFDERNPHREIIVYAALDNMSSACFVSREVWEKLGSPGEPAEIKMKTMTDESRQRTVAVSNLNVVSLYGNERIRLPKVYRQETLPIDINEIPSHRTLHQWPHLRRLITDMPDLDRTVPVGLLIGVNCPQALQPKDFIASVDQGPFAIRTALGWCISGPLQRHDSDLDIETISCFRIKADETPICTPETGPIGMTLQVYESELNNPSSNEMSSNWSPSNKAGELVHSQENFPFLNRVDQDTKFDDDRCESNMSVCDAEVAMPHSRAQALQIMNYIEKRENNSKRLPLRYATLVRL